MPQLVPFFSIPDFSGLTLVCITIAIVGIYIIKMTKWDNACPRCAEKGIKQYVLPGEHCPRCNQAC